jgi:hypothetical protein
MADRKVDLGTKITSAVAAMAAAFVARKVITLVWTKATGKEPPTHPEDPQVALREALSWSMLTGVTVEAARLLATRAAARRTHSGPDCPADKLAIAIFGKLTPVVHKEAPRTRELVRLTGYHPEREFLVRQVCPRQLQGLGNVVGVKIDSAR